jgi:eukaryotic-like serine/threonine-protein kinase
MELHHQATRTKLVELELIPGRRHSIRLREIAGQTDPDAEPVLGVLTLARALWDAGEGGRAVELLRAAVRARPREVILYDHLARLLVWQEPRRWPEAMECYAAMRALRPEVGIFLANALLSSGRDGDGLALLEQLVREDPKNPAVHGSLSYALSKQGKVDKAIDECRKAIEIDDKYAAAHYYLGILLHGQGKLREAIAKYREAIERDPNYVLAHINLGIALRHQKRHAAAARHYADAFAAKPEFAADLAQQHRYQAACSAALAAAGQGEDARVLPDKVLLMFRRWVLEWMRADLRDYERLARQGNAAFKTEIGKRLMHWRGDPDLASVRDSAALDRLPEPERATWRDLWGRVDELLKGLGSGSSPPPPA